MAEIFHVLRTVSQLLHNICIKAPKPSVQGWLQAREVTRNCQVVQVGKIWEWDLTRVTQSFMLGPQHYSGPT